MIAIRSTAGRRCKRWRRVCWSTTSPRCAPARRHARISGLLDALAAILADRTLEPAFVALALTVPGEADIAREIGRDVDPDAIFAARAALRAAIGTHLGAALSERYQQPRPIRGPYSPDAASAGRRTLRHICLDLMAATGRPDAIAAAARQYQTADNMTDRMAALSTLALCAVPERAAALDDFFCTLQATIR